MRVWLMMLAGATAAPAIAADQFDLICKAGKSTTHYRVDLARNEACESTCDRVWKMGEATSGELKLINRVPAYRGDLEERATVNRATGEYRYYSSLSGHHDSEEGKCEPAPFSGFPQAKF